MAMVEKRATVILVHGAWAGGSSWANVIPPLRDLGLEVFAAPIPMTSLGDDVAALTRYLDRASAPVVLVGHAYAGEIIAEAVTHDEIAKHDPSGPTEITYEQ
ncbi:esterase/lipase family protein [Rhizobium sp. BR 362]|uniref:esterase/lipase family protein n=1 Tax=Rhizobium sp. BR 362 TaxID=3040670 RepID=UPI002F418E6B